MDKASNDQYQTPRTVYSEALYSAIEQSAVPSTPERLAAPWQFAKDVEAIMDSFRETQEAIEHEKGRELSISYTPFRLWRPARTHASILKDQLDIEKQRGAVFFQDPSYSVWYGGQTHTPQTSANLASWYISYNGNDKQSGEQLLRIQTHPQRIQMFNQDAQEVPMTLEDVERFVTIVKNYPLVMLPAYPFEQDRAEVLLDALVLPDNVTALMPPPHHDQSTILNRAA